MKIYGFFLGATITYVVAWVACFGGPLVSWDHARLLAWAGLFLSAVHVFFAFGLLQASIYTKERTWIKVLFLPWPLLAGVYFLRRVLLVFLPLSSFRPWGHFLFLFYEWGHPPGILCLAIACFSVQYVPLRPAFRWAGSLFIASLLGSYTVYLADRLDHHRYIDRYNLGFWFYVPTYICLMFLYYRLWRGEKEDPLVEAIENIGLS